MYVDLCFHTYRPRYIPIIPYVHGLTWLIGWSDGLVPALSMGFRWPLTRVATCSTGLVGYMFCHPCVGVFGTVCDSSSHRLMAGMINRESEYVLNCSEMGILPVWDYQTSGCYGYWDVGHPTQLLI